MHTIDYIHKRSERHMLSTLNCKQRSVKAFARSDGQGQCVVWQQNVNVLQWEGVPGVRLEALLGRTRLESCSLASQLQLSVSCDCGRLVL